MIKHDWRKIIKKAWSVRFMFLAAFLSGVEVALPLLDGFVNVRPSVFAGLSFLAVSGAFISRLIVQKEFKNEHKE